MGPLLASRPSTAVTPIHPSGRDGLGADGYGVVGDGGSFG